MLRYRFYICTILLMFVLAPGISNAQSKGLDRLLTPADSLSWKRMGPMVGVGASIYGASTYLLYQYWYKDYPLTTFHFFNDNAEWYQMDKGGHVFNAYFQSWWIADAYKWAGMKTNKAYWYGGLTGSLFQLTVEVLDAHSENWGFSAMDFVANTVGAGLVVAQGLAWDEMRFQVKISAHKVNYDEEVEDRAEALYGTTIPERFLKDYNGLTYWLSVNPSTFMKEDTRFPKWLNFSLGYGSEGLLGGFSNTWCSDGEIRPEDCPEDLLIDFTHIPRIRQYYFSLDVDLTRIPTKSKALKFFFGMFNIIKIPAPALEINSEGNFKFHWIHF